MLGQKTKSKTLKRAILEGIREDNLRLDNPQRPPLQTTARATRKKPKAPNRFIGMALALVAGLSVFFLFSRLEEPLTASRPHSDIDVSQQPVQVASLPLSDTLSTDLVPSETPPINHSETIMNNLEVDSIPAYSLDTRDYEILVNNNDVRLTTLFGLGVRIIVIDPGHGGKDPGAIGAEGTTEKEVTLDVANRLKNRLEEKSTFNIYLTRETDETMSLSDRVKFTNVLTEISCISEPEEEKKLNTTEYREKIASFIEKGIIAYLTPKQVQAQRGDKDESKKDG